MPDADRLAGTYLAFDYGSRRIGIAIGEAILGTARPLNTAANLHGQPDWSVIDALVEHWQPAGMVIGIPLLVNGEEQPLTGQARGFGKRLRKRYSLNLFEADERFSSMDAQRELADMRSRGQRTKRIDRADIDATAAALILEAWFRSGKVSIS